jgi:hypothetical protein
MTLTLVGMIACARNVPLSDPAAEGVRVPAELLVPLDVQEYEVASADGYRGVFLKLTRLPDGIEHRSESKPARIILEVKGPTGQEVPEESFPGRDTEISRLRVSRAYGVLRVVLDLPGDEPPEYSVHAMADWVMIRFRPREQS